MKIPIALITTMCTFYLSSMRGSEPDSTYKTFCAAKVIIHYIDDCQKKYQDDKDSGTIVMTRFFKIDSTSQLQQGLVLEVQMGVPLSLIGEWGRWIFRDNVMVKNNGDARLMKDLSAYVCLRSIEKPSKIPVLKTEFYGIHAVDTVNLPEPLFKPESQMGILQDVKGLFASYNRRYNQEFPPQEEEESQLPPAVHEQLQRYVARMQAKGEISQPSLYEPRTT